RGGASWTSRRAVSGHSRTPLRGRKWAPCRTRITRVAVTTRSAPSPSPWTPTVSPAVAIDATSWSRSALIGLLRGCSFMGGLHHERERVLGFEWDPLVVSGYRRYHGRNRSRHRDEGLGGLRQVDA